MTSEIVLSNKGYRLGRSPKGPGTLRVAKVSILVTPSEREQIEADMLASGRDSLSSYARWVLLHGGRVGAPQGQDLEAIR